jgi:hypothetical protein
MFFITKEVLEPFGQLALGVINNPKPTLRVLHAHAGLQLRCAA